MKNRGHRLETHSCLNQCCIYFYLYIAVSLSVNQVCLIRVREGHFGVSCKRHFISEFSSSLPFAIAHVYVLVYTIAVSLSVNQVYRIRVREGHFRVITRGILSVIFLPHCRLPIAHVYVLVYTIAVSLSVNQVYRIRVREEHFRVSCKRHYIWFFFFIAVCNCACICTCIYHSCVIVYEPSLLD